MLAMVLGIWIHEIFFARRHRSFFERARDVASDVADGVSRHLGRAFDAHDMDKYLAAAILFGIKKYSDRHPQMRRAIHDIINGTNVDSDDYADDYDAPAPRQRAATRTTRATSKSGTTARRATAASRRATR